VSPRLFKIETASRKSSTVAKELKLGKVNLGLGLEKGSSLDVAWYFPEQAVLIDFSW
jgi:hypothetical protein